MNLFMDNNPVDGICELICRETLQCLRDSSVPMTADEIIKLMAHKNHSNYTEAELFITPLLRYGVEYGFLRQLPDSRFVYNFRTAAKALKMNRKANEVGGVKSVAFNWLESRQERFEHIQKPIHMSEGSKLSLIPKIIAKVKPLKKVRQ